MRQSACGGMTAPRSAGSNQQVRIPAALPPAMSAVSESPIIRHCSGRTPGSCARHRSKNTRLGFSAPICPEMNSRSNASSIPARRRRFTCCAYGPLLAAHRRYFPCSRASTSGAPATGTALSCRRSRNASSIAAPSASSPSRARIVCQRTSRSPAIVSSPRSIRAQSLSFST